jgi:hypothetical protein
MSSVEFDVVVDGVSVIYDSMHRGVVVAVGCSLTHLEIADNPMHPEWQRAVVKGLPYLFHHCRQVANERKYEGKPPEMQYVSLLLCFSLSPSLPLSLLFPQPLSLPLRLPLPLPLPLSLPSPQCSVPCGATACGTGTWRSASKARSC